MRKIKITSLVVIFLLLSCSEKKLEDPISGYNQIVTKYTEIEQLISKEANDTFYVYIRLPKHYSKTNKRYPVLYLLDGDISFNMATSVIRYLQYGKHIPDIIIAAPAYGTMMNDEEINYRERDYTISQIERFSGSGEAEKYLKFFKNELIPRIDSLYRTDSKRILNGFSLGGLFALYTMVKEPDLIDNFIIGSPYLKNDIEFLEKTTKILPSFNNRKRLFISVGEFEDNEDYHEPIDRMLDILSNKKNIKVMFRKFEKGTHFTTPSEALAYGLKFVFDGDNR
ncbi:MAG: alpha/beta hydrolase-fold protein [Melioribacteraceae bacterium]|nr:alpha/beta hydrolase-fold protein [Melioribacteraceae bacterium]